MLCGSTPCSVANHREPKASANASTFVPDRPGRVAAGATVEEVECDIREAFEYHHDGMRDDGILISVPSRPVRWVDVPARLICRAAAPGRRCCPLGCCAGAPVARCAGRATKEPA